MPTSINLGKIRPVDKGEWSSTYEGGYDILDIVTSGKGSYMSKVKLNTFALTDRTKWIPLVDSAAVELAIQAANDAAGAADAARMAIQADLALKASHGYASNPKTLKQVDDSLVQLAGEVSLLDAVQGAKIKDIENVLSTANIGQSAKISVTGTSPLSLPKNAANSGMSVKMEGLTQDVGGVITHFDPTGRVRSVDKNGLNPTALYLTAPELRSNGTVKDEIRKGANGYELVKRVGVGTLGGEKLVNGNFDNGAINWSVFGGVVVTDRATFNGVAWQGITQSMTPPVSNVFFAYSYEVKAYSSGDLLIYAGDQNSRNTRTSVGMYKAIIKGGTSNLILSLGGQSFTGEVDNISVKQITPLDGDPAYDSNSYYTDLGNGQILYTLGTPVISPISHGGILNSAENGTVYHEPVIADAGVYGTNMPILLTDYPIASIEEIIKHENGVDTYLNVATAVVAPDGLSFTHPDLGSGDLVLFTYAFDKESTNGNFTATFYDSNVVKIDTVTGKAYKITDVVTNGVLTRTLTEV